MGILSAAQDAISREEAIVWLVTFFEQFGFTADEQSWIIQAFGQEKRDLAEVAQQWINDNP